jgi:hypothetical protein
MACIDHDVPSSEVRPVWKAVFLILILLGAALYFPQTRPVVVDTLGPVMNPVLTWQTKGEMDRIGRELQSLNRQGSDLPAPGASFQYWMDRNFMGGAKTDAWGTYYALTVWRDSIGIVSHGPDLEIGTPDDLVQRVLMQRQRGRR